MLRNLLQTLFTNVVYKCCLQMYLLRLLFVEPPSQEGVCMCACVHLRVCPHICACTCVSVRVCASALVLLLEFADTGGIMIIQRNIGKHLFGIGNISVSCPKPQILFLFYCLLDFELALFPMQYSFLNSICYFYIYILYHTFISTNTACS